MTSTISNQDIIWEFTKAKAVLEIIDNKPFRVRAYQNAIDTISSLDQELTSIIQNTDLSTLPGIGKELSEKIHDLIRDGYSDGLNKLFIQVPAGMFELIKVPGIGSKKAFRLAVAFELNEPGKALETLKLAASQDKVSVLEGFGSKSQSDILKNISEVKPKSSKIRIDKADAIASQVINYLKGIKQVDQVVSLGSIRRRVETVGDIDIGLVTSHPNKVMAEMKKFNQLKSVQATGDNIIRLRLLSGHQVDIKFSAKNQFGSLLQHFTGSRSHNIKLRKLALKSDMSLSEHGVKINSENNHIADEKELYSLLGLQYIPPELRHGEDEISLAQHHKLPKLVEISDILGETHTHTNCDWVSSHDYGESVGKLLDKAVENNLSWIVLGDHQPAKSAYEYISYAKLISSRSNWIEQEYSAWKKRVKNTIIEIYSSLEVDIDKSGNVMIDNSASRKLDLVIASIHSHFQLTQKQQTQRLLKAISTPRVKIIAHPTGRLLDRRSGIQVDWQQVFAACVEHKVALEINANPNRLDLPYSLVKQAKEIGIKFTIGTDAHKAKQLDYLKYGVDVARRGWLSSHDIINTYSNTKFSSWVKS